MHFVKNIITTIPNKINHIVPNNISIIRNSCFPCKYSALSGNYFLLSVILFVHQKGGGMQEDNMTVVQWCGQWFTANRHKWNGNTKGGYRNLICSHLLPNIENAALSGLTEQAVTDFYDNLRSHGPGVRSIWCIHLLLRRPALRLYPRSMTLARNTPS